MLTLKNLLGCQKRIQFRVYIPVQNEMQVLRLVSAFKQAIRNSLGNPNIRHECIIDLANLERSSWNLTGLIAEHDIYIALS